MGCTSSSVESDGSRSQHDLQGKRSRQLVHMRRASRAVDVPPRIRWNFEDLLSLAKYWDHYYKMVEGNLETNCYTLMIKKYPQIFTTHFKCPAGQNLGSDPLTEVPLNIEKHSRHMSMTLDVINKCVQKAIAGELWQLEDALRRLGSLHAELWITAKEMLTFEESFIWSLENVDPQMDEEQKEDWRKFIEFVLFNIVIGLNSHHEKMTYVLEPQLNRRICCWGRKPPAGIDPKTNSSLRRMTGHIMPG